MGVVFFPSLPFMGVMLFPSFMLGNAFGEGSGPLALLSLFFFLLLLSFPFFLPLSSSPAFSSASLFLLYAFLLCPYLFSSFLPITLPFFFLNSFHPFSSSPLFHFPFSCLLLTLSFSFVPLLFFFFFFFLREYLVLSVFQDVIEDTTDCNRIRF